MCSSLCFLINSAIFFVNLSNKQEYQAMIIQINKDNEYLLKRNYLMKHFQTGTEECLIIIRIVVI